jgi:hypothetical protein
MTTITTGTSGPKAWKMILAGAAVGLATIAIVNLPQTTSNTTSEPATDASQAVTAESPQNRSFFEENQATGQTPTPGDSVAGFEYGSESTAGAVVGPGVTTQYLGNSGELFPYENGSAPAQAPTGFGGPMPQATLNQAEIDRLAPVTTQGFLDGPSSGTQGASRIDPGVAAAAGLNPGAVDAIVGGTTQVAPSPDNLADAHARVSVGTQAEPRAFAASDEALVSPVPEVDAAQLIADLIASEPSAPAYALAASDEALIRGTSLEPIGVPDVATNARWEVLDEAYRNSTAASYVGADPDPVVPGSANTSAKAGTDARWGSLHEASHDGTLSGYTSRSAQSDPADKKYLEGQPDAVPSGEPHVPMANNRLQ